MLQFFKNPIWLTIHQPSVIINKSLLAFPFFKKLIIGNDVYDVIKEYIVAHLENGMRVEDASKNLNVVERQMEIWLKRLCEDKLIRLDKGVYRKA